MHAICIQPKNWNIPTDVDFQQHFNLFILLVLTTGNSSGYFADSLRVPRALDCVLSAKSLELFQLVELQ